MVTLQELVEIGFTEKEAKKLVENSFFRSKFAHWSKERLQEKIDKIVSVYGKESKGRILRILVSFPPFISYNHERALQKATRVYGQANKPRIIKTVLKFPAFVGYNHERVLRHLTRIGRKVGLTKQQCIDLILSISGLATYSIRFSAENALTVYFYHHFLWIVIFTRFHRQIS